MAGGKKKKKPAANPARGFATTSVASKYRQEEAEDAADAAGGPSKENAPPSAAQPNAKTASGKTASGPAAAGPTKELSPEEFERQLEESELQLLVEKYAAKVRRDAQRQRGRLETDRRLLRGQADAINTKKWLPQDLVDQLLHVIDGESRFSSSGISSESHATAKPLPEEDVTMKLWTLQLTLAAAGFPAPRIQAVLQHILDVYSTILPPQKDLIWGLEEALDWLARECAVEELPDYDKRAPQIGKQPGMLSAQSTLHELTL